jgi:hypothetical protein
MHNNQQRYLGMTVTQLIVLACLGLATIGIMGFAAITILGKMTSLNGITNSPTQENQAASSPLPTRTPFSSPTPILPSLTFTATTYESLIPGEWKQAKYEKVELWMPAEFVQKSDGGYLLYAENGNENGNGFIVSVNLTNEKTTLSNLDDFVQEGLTQFTPQMTFLEKKNFQIGTYEALRLKVQMIFNSVPMGEAIYFIKDGDTVWILSGLSHYDEFRNWILIFDKIARTFRINQ